MYLLIKPCNLTHCPLGLIPAMVWYNQQHAGHYLNNTTWYIALLWELTHWRRVMHSCVGYLTIIGSDNGSSSGRRQATIWTRAGIVLIGPLGTIFNEISIEIHIFSVKKMHLKRPSAKWQPFCLGLGVLTHWVWCRGLLENLLPTGSKINRNWRLTIIVLFYIPAKLGHYSWYLKKCTDCTEASIYICISHNRTKQ